MKLVGVVTVPATALLVPDIAAGAAHELEELRAAALSAVAALAAEAEHILVIAGTAKVTEPLWFSAETTATWASVGYQANVPLGVAAREPHATMQDPDATVPVAITLGAWLLNSCAITAPRSYLAVPADPDLSRGIDIAPEDRLGVVVLADGSCTRGPKAPGSEVSGAIEHDEELLGALHAVDTGWFLDPQRRVDAHTFGDQGLGAWAVAARLVADQKAPWKGKVQATADPYGVFYAVATWQPTPPA